MSARLRLDLIQRTYSEGDHWTWRLWAGSRVVSSSGRQLYSRRADCCRGAEVGGGLLRVRAAIRYGLPAARMTPEGSVLVLVRVLDERTTP